MMLIFNLTVIPLIVVGNCFLLGWIVMKLTNEKLGQLVSLGLAAIQLGYAWLPPQELGFRLGLTLGALFVFATVWQSNKAKA